MWPDDAYPSYKKKTPEFILELVKGWKTGKKIRNTYFLLA